MNKLKLRDIFITILLALVMFFGMLLMATVGPNRSIFNLKDVFTVENIKEVSLVLFIGFPTALIIRKCFLKWKE
jgi:ABC-type spermidine/putrescine transport system permease subunit I